MTGRAGATVIMGLGLAALVSACAPPAVETPNLLRTGPGWSRHGLDGVVPAHGACRYGVAADGYPLPDRRCTPGAVDTAVGQANIHTTICRSGYTRSVRPPEAVTEPAKLASMAAYGASDPPSRYEYDHLVPLELGGSSDVRNLWPQPDVGRAPGPGTNAKDGVEERLHAAVCSGRVTLAAAQAAIARDWTTAESALAR
jgi:hypothetical protein